MSHPRLIFLSALLAVSAAVAACSPINTQPTVEISITTTPTPTVEPTAIPTEPPTEVAPSGGLPIQGGGPEAISAGNIDRLTSLSTLALPTTINTLAFTPNSATLAAATPNGVGIFDIATG